MFARVVPTRYRGSAPSAFFCPFACRHNSRKQKEAEEIAAKEEAKKAKEKRAQMVLEVNQPSRTRIRRLVVVAVWNQTRCVEAGGLSCTRRR